MVFLDFGGEGFLGGSVGGGNGNRSGGAAEWRCEACTYDNSGLLSVCEMCGTSRGETGIASSSSSDYRWNRDSDSNISLDELRRRRIERFAR